MMSSSNDEFTKVQLKIASMRTLSAEQKAEEERYGVSTELALYKAPWTIKKNLTESDLGNHSRLIIHTDLAKEHIIKYLSEEDKRAVEDGTGITINMIDHDTHETWPVVFKWYESSRSYVINGGWRSSFVRERDLKKDEEIGLFWGGFKTLHFRVLSRVQAYTTTCKSKQP